MGVSKKRYGRGAWWKLRVTVTNSTQSVEQKSRTSKKQNQSGLSHRFSLNNERIIANVNTLSFKDTDREIQESGESPIPQTGTILCGVVGRDEWVHSHTERTVGTSERCPEISPPVNPQVKSLDDASGFSSYLICGSPAEPRSGNLSGQFSRQRGHRVSRRREHILVGILLAQCFEDLTIAMCKFVVLVPRTWKMGDWISRKRRQAPSTSGEL